MNNLNTFKTYTTKTRNAARTLVNTLKTKGFQPSTPTKKSGKGWLVATHKTVARSVKQRYEVINSQAVLVG
jgi:hypothetical protein